MRLSDVMSHAGLSGYAVVAMILFLLAFLVVAIRVLLASRREMDRQARMPLDDGTRAREGDQP